jgi:hypothetical protein
VRLLGDTKAVIEARARDIHDSISNLPKFSLDSLIHGVIGTTLYTCMTAPVDAKLLDEVLLLDVAVSGTDINLLQVDAVMCPSGGLVQNPENLVHLSVVRIFEPSH